MFGILFGTACLIGLFVMLKRGRHAHGWGGGCGRGHGYGHGRWGRGRGWRGRDYDEVGGEGGDWHGKRGFERAFLRHVFERLDTTPGQEKVIIEAVNEITESLKSARSEVGQSRSDVARAVSSEDFDAGAIGAAYARQDDVISKVRDSVTGALAKVHDALDANQRAELAKLIGEGSRRWSGGPFGGFGGGGPYRA